MTPISDIENLERLRKAAIKGPGWWDDVNYVTRLHDLAPSLIADWKAMRGEIERLTKERDEAYEEAAQVCIVEANADTSGDDWGDGFNTGCLACARDIRDLKAKEPKP